MCLIEENFKIVYHSILLVVYVFVNSDFWLYAQYINGNILFYVSFLIFILIKFYWVKVELVNKLCKINNFLLTNMKHNKTNKIDLIECLYNMYIYTHTHTFMYLYVDYY